MVSAPLAAAVALTVAVAAPALDELAMAFPSMARTSAAALPSATGIIISALPPAPDRVYLETRTYGTVMVDHRAHLARRVACKACHGTGPVSQIPFTPRSAHDSCRSCHEEAKRGPTACRDCHVQTAGPPAVSSDERVRFVFRGPGGERTWSAKSSRAVAVKTPAAPATAAIATPASEQRLFPGGDLASFSAERLAETRGGRLGSSREVGFAVGTDGGQPCASTTLRLAMRSDGFVVTEGLQWVAGDSTGRLRALLGGGYAIPLRSSLDLQVLGVVGVDMRYSPMVAFRPAVGGSTELVWTRSSFPRMLGVALNATTALGPAAYDRQGNAIGGLTLSMGLVAAFWQGG